MILRHAFSRLFIAPSLVKSRLIFAGNFFDPRLDCFGIKVVQLEDEKFQTHVPWHKVGTKLIGRLSAKKYVRSASPAPIFFPFLFFSNLRYANTGPRGVAEGRPKDRPKIARQRDFWAIQGGRGHPEAGRCLHIPKFEKKKKGKKMGAGGGGTRKYLKLHSESIGEIPRSVSALEVAFSTDFRFWRPHFL